MITIYKYEIPLSKVFTVELPSCAEFLTVEMQHNVPQMWFRVNDANLPVMHKFALCATGGELHVSMCEARYLGTVHANNGELVLHLFGNTYKPNMGLW